jgi:DNA-binding CsgD family transcriptional regulator
MSIKLTPRSVQLLELAERGMSYHQMATELELSPHTIKCHFSRLFKKLGVHNQMAAVHKWRGERPTDALVNELRRSRAINQENIVALQELIRLQTAVIEMALERVHGEPVTKT